LVKLPVAEMTGGNVLMIAIHGGCENDSAYKRRMRAMIESVGIIGAGTMGNGVAQICAAAGLTVVMVDISDAAVARGLANVRNSLDRLVNKEKMTATDREATLARISAATDNAKLATSDLVIEAATENQELKLKILKEVCAVLKPSALVATNTSSISITKLAASTDRPDRFIGMHFFNPVPLMALLELIRGLQTSDDTHAKSEAFAKRIGKVSITVKNSPGFAVNRILCPMINEAIFTLQEGLATAEDIDAGMKLGCNHPIGPLALADLIGLDTMLSVMEVFYEGFNDSKYRPSPLLKEMVAAGHLGRKTGRGFYRYGAPA
jgi:3-hydroxybutyryl-CoA dehydrogenase